MCNNCIHAPVCGKCKATGGQVGKCEHFAEEKRGRWIETTDPLSLFISVRCSQCNNVQRYGHPFCPNCGARMDK